MFARPSRHTPLLAVTVFASAGAGAIHAAAAPEHTNWSASVVFFVSLAVFQIGWAAYLLARRPGPSVLLLGAGVNLLAFATWAVSRSAGLPFGPHRGEAESAARADVIACMLGLAVALGAIGIVRRWDRQPLPRTRSALSTGAGGIAISALSLVALTGISGHAHAQGADHGHVAPATEVLAEEEAAVAPEAVTETTHLDDGHSH